MFYDKQQPIVLGIVINIFIGVGRVTEILNCCFIQ